MLLCLLLGREVDDGRGRGRRQAEWRPQWGAESHGWREPIDKGYRHRDRPVLAAVRLYPCSVLALYQDHTRDINGPPEEMERVIVAAIGKHARGDVEALARGIIEELRAAGLEIQRIDAILIRNPRRRADPDGLLRHVVYLGEREDKPASDVRRPRLGG